MNLLKVFRGYSKPGACKISQCIHHKQEGDSAHICGLNTEPEFLYKDRSYKIKTKQNVYFCKYYKPAE